MIKEFSETEWKTAEAPAKINLYFEVLRRLSSGYHEIESLVTPISLYDKILVRSSKQLSFHIEAASSECISSEPSIPTDESNLVLRACRLLQRRSGRLDGADIILQKRIPSQAGLGGGSSDAAATLILLNDLWNLGFCRDELAEMGAELGCDVPLFLKGFPVICRGRGEILEVIPDGESLPKLFFVVGKPLEGCSTPEVYRRCTPQGSSDVRYIKNMVQDWREAQWTDFAAGLKNRLLEPAMQISRGVGHMMNLFQNAPDPCLGVSMTGSGSACFGLCRNQAHAVEVANFLEQHQSGTIFVAESACTPVGIHK